MPIDGQSKSQGWSPEEVAQAISNALWAMSEKFFKKQVAFKKHIYYNNSGTQIPFPRQLNTKGFLHSGLPGSK